MSVAPPSGQDRIMIYGPKTDGTYIVEFRIADGESLAISVPAGETHVLKHFQARMPYSMKNLWARPGRSRGSGLPRRDGGHENPACDAATRETGARTWTY